MSEYVSPDAVVVPAWVALVGNLAPFSSILMFLSPIPTIRQVLRNGTVGDLPLLPYTSMVTSCFVWIIYGIMKHEPSIWLTNLVEFILSVYYFVEFTNYAPKSSPTFPGSVYRHIQMCVGTWVCSVFIALFFSNAVDTIGELTVMLTILTFASPLAAVKAVLESNSSESIPWPFTLAALVNCTLWTIVGVAEMHDYYVYFPALLGLIFASLQVALKLHFGDHETDAPTYTRPPVDMPYPVLGSVRSMVLYGSSPASNHYSNLPQDLQFDSNMSNTDYVELGVPLEPQRPQSTNSISSQEFPAYVDQPASVEFSVAPPTHKHRKSNDGLDESIVEGLQTIIFEEDNNGIGSTPPPPVSFRDSVRSRSHGVQPGQGHGY